MPYHKNMTKRYLKGALEKIKSSIYKPVSELNATAWITPEPVPFSDRMSGERKTIFTGQSWGKLWDCAWFNFKGTVPGSASGKNVVLLIDLSGEACIVDEAGCPVQGLTTVSSEFDLSLGRPGKKVVRYLECAKGGETVNIWADAGCNDLFGKYQDSGTLKEAYIAIYNEQMEQLYYDFEVLYELMGQIPEDKSRYNTILFTLEEATKCLREFTEQEAIKAREILSKELNKKGGDESLSVSAVGHAHIDLAWLWPIRETIRKGARTFSTVLKNMEKYPDYVFGASQAQLYQWMKDNYPALYAKIKEKVEEGRWEVQGAMWVEADTNISGGEALVRQVLYGKRFFMDEFGKDMKVLWLPDVFGYTAALPQILKKAGVEYFMTIKLSWNEVNMFPHHTFIWKGLDGSEILAHMPPEGTYNSSAAPRAIAASEKRFLDKGISDRCLLLFGIGDGGGGPGEEHLERLKREKNLNGLAPVTQQPAIDFFNHINKDRDKYKKWQGELYLEKHQGTYTSQARNKRYNRKLEIAIRELEFAASAALMIFGSDYPQDELDKIWKEMLLYQFHDIIPGSSITRVYCESLERYAKLLARTKELTNNAYTSIVKNIDTNDSKNPALAVNTLSWDRNEWVYCNGKWMQVNVPAMGYAVVDMSAEENLPALEFKQEDILENDKLKVEFNEDGSIKSVLDKEFGRSVLEKGKCGNQLAVYEDYGDAWDFPIQYDEKPAQVFKLIDSTNSIDGPRMIRKNTYTYGKSKLVQEVVLTDKSRRIDFSTTVDWREENRMLRALFPLNVYSDHVTCDIQFGNVRRPTHQNTSWDMAKYEICAHKWVDISQEDYGVALLNDCKYGHKVSENIISLNLLRSSTYPDPVADRAIHYFTYSLYPHGGNCNAGGVIKAGYELNMPLAIVPVEKNSGALPISKSFMNIDADNVIIETIKKAEDSNDIIVRLYESMGKGVKTKLKFGFAVKDIELVNIMEQKIDSDVLDKESFELRFTPFEIHTLKIGF